MKTKELYKVFSSGKIKKKKGGGGVRKNVVHFPRPPKEKNIFSAFARLSLKIYIFKLLLKKHSKHRIMNSLK